MRFNLLTILKIYLGLKVSLASNWNLTVNLFIQISVVTKVPLFGFWVLGEVEQRTSFADV